MLVVGCVVAPLLVVQIRTRVLVVDFTTCITLIYVVRGCTMSIVSLLKPPHNNAAALEAGWWR